MSETLQRDALPSAVLAYIDRSTGSERPGVVDLFTADARITDEGRTHRGTAEIAAWLQETSGLYTYTLELLGAERRDDGRYAVLHHMVGDFPGGVVDLTFVFALRDGAIAELDFE